MPDYIVVLIFSIFEPVNGFLFHGNSRYFAPALFSGLVFYCVLCRVKGKKDLGMHKFFESETWLSKSALADYKVVIINSFLWLLIFGAFVTYFKDIVQGITLFVTDQLGVTIVNTEFSWFWAGAMTFCLFIVGDFLHWWTHYIQHKIPALWELHKVHHSAETLNLVTSNRFHPLEIVITSLVTGSASAIVAAVFISFFGDAVSVVTIAGANALWFVFNLAGGALRHSPLWLSFGPFWERWLISPAMHQIHHSDEVRHYDKNFGGALAIWDRMFGTIAPAYNDKVTKYGIGEESAQFHSLYGIYLRPILRVLDIFRTYLVKTEPKTDVSTSANTTQVPDAAEEHAIKDGHKL